MGKLAKYLNQHIVGNVFDRPLIRDAYANDRSILQIMPRLVALPENLRDVRKLVLFSAQLAKQGYELPITVRGAGTGKTGAALGEGIVLSMAKLNRIEEIDVRGRLVRVQPGITLGGLNAALALYGLCLPISQDPNRTIGGLIGDYPSGDASAARYGGIYSYVERAEVVLSSGEVVQFAPFNARALNEKKLLSSFEGALYRKLDRLLDEQGDTVVDRGMRPFDAAGYANIIRVRQAHNFSLLPLLFAAQGTLGIVTDVILHLEVLPAHTRRLGVIFPEWDAALRFLNFVRDLDPSRVEVFDGRIIQVATHYGNSPDLLGQKFEGGWLVMTEFSDRKARTARKIQHCLEILPLGTLAIEETPENTLAFTEFQTALTSYLNDDPSGEHFAVLDDVYVPSYKMSEFLQGLEMLEQTLDLELPIFGSFATSNYHVRPALDCSTLEGREQLLDFLQQYGKLVRGSEGSLTGGSPEGRTKVLPAAPAFSEREAKLYAAIKDAFDPQGIFNPYVKLGAEFQNVVRFLRTDNPGGIIHP